MKLKKDKVAEFFRAMAAAIEKGDSFEGSIFYTCMEDGLEPQEFELTGGVRVGNSEGQGGWTILEHSDPARNLGSDKGG